MPRRISSSRCLLALLAVQPLVQGFMTNNHFSVTGLLHPRDAASLHAINTNSLPDPTADDDQPASSFTQQPSSSSSPYDNDELIQKAAKSDDKKRTDRELGGYDPSERLGEGIEVGDPQIKVKEKDQSVTAILRELAAIQQQGPRKYCILGTRHCSFLHQQIIELL